MSVGTGSEVVVARRRLLEFFDEAPTPSLKHATAVVSVAGEELGIGLLLHYLESQGHEAEFVNDIVTTGQRKAPGSMLGCRPRMFSTKSR